MRREAPALFLLACAALLFAPFWWGGRVFVPGDFLSFIYPWKQLGLPAPHNLELFDVTVFFYPQDIFLNSWLKAGVFPLWNPQILCGHPMVGSGQSALLYPPRLLAHLLLTPAVARTLIIAIHVTLDGLFMYLWLRGRGLLPWAAVVGGLAWMLNGQVAGWMEFEHVPVIAAWLPLMLWAVDRRRWGLMAVAGALSLHGGHLQYNLYTGLVVGFYVSMQLRSRRDWLALAGTTVLTLMLAAPTLLPFLELLSQSQRAEFTLEQLRTTMAPTLSSLLGTLVCPDLLGNPARGFMINRVQANLIYPEFACFFGLLPLGLALLALRRPGSSGLPRREIWAWGILMLVSLLIAAATPFYQLVLVLVPKLKILVPARILLTFHFAGATLAAQGAHRWLQDGGPRRGWLGAPLVAWLAILGWIHWQLAVMTPGQLAQQFPIKIPPLDAGPQVLEAAARANYSSPQMWAPVLILVGLLALGRRRWGAALAVLTACDLLLFAVSFNTTVSPTELFPPVEPLTTLQGAAGPYRVDKLHAAFYNTMTPYGLRLLTGYESMFPRRVFQTMAAAEPDSRLSMRSVSLQRFDAPLLDGFALRYLVLPPQEKLTSPRWRELRPGLYENEKALKRAFVVGSYRVFPGLDQVTAAMAGPEFRPGEWVALEQEPGGPVERAAADSEVNVTDDRPGRTVLEAKMKAPGLVVLSDTLYPGWEARVDGVPQPILAANGCCRAVRVDRGDHVVEYAYRPASLRSGLGACGLALLCLSLGWVYGFFGEGKSDVGSSLTT